MSEGVIRIDFYDKHFLFSPREVCVDLDDYGDRATGRSPVNCAQACVVLVSCVGFVDSVDSEGACVMADSDAAMECNGR